jgi:hypothetical protein
MCPNRPERKKGGGPGIQTEVFTGQTSPRVQGLTRKKEDMFRESGYADGIPDLWQGLCQSDTGKG